MNRLARCGIAALVMMVLAQPSLAAESTAIFNGKNLSGWKVKGAKVRARNGVMTLERANGWVYYEKTPHHFVLTLEFRLPGQNSKIAFLVRAHPNGDDETVPNYAPRVVLAPADAARSGTPPWHRLEIECTGFTFKAKLDGEAVYSLDDLMTVDGHLGLAVLEGSAELRNVQLTEVAMAGPIRRGDGVYMLHKSIANPSVVKRVDPHYPRALGAAGIEGEVWLAVTVLTTGEVGEARIVRSVPGLDQPALDAAKQWTFNPATLDGKPVAIVVTIAIEFSVRR